MRNHGDSPRSPDHGYEAMAGDLAETVSALGGRADVLGHSMGGKAAMVLALSEPERVRRLVVADMAPVTYGHSQMRYVKAMEGIELGAVRRRADADRALAAAVPEAGLRAFFLQSLAIGDSGARWKLNLPALGEQMPRIMGFPDGLGSFDGPTLFLTGGRSDYVRPDDWARIRSHFPAARLETTHEAGHWLHADAPEAFARTVAAFLDD
jgi:pimeloyl-ACP methyl ester carboxylesterase